MRRIIGLRGCLAVTLLLACGSDTDPSGPLLSGFEWVQVFFGMGEAINVAVLEPEGPPKGVIMAFPWGSGQSELVLSMMDSYWDEAVIDAGYVTIGVEVFGPGFETLGPLVMPDLLQWLDLTYPTAAGDIVMVGASNGGTGVFHAALSAPGRVAGIIAMPGQYSGEPANLSVLSGVPVRLMAGENDVDWVSAGQSTLAALESAGVTATLEILPGQDHVLDVPQQDLLDWIEAR